ncbi:MAG: helix-turn-helix domain-containing protein [Oscillospiraceae bacterium]|nr:helix-turn-helix domain-containing protein [Oscillospiraceae bacterium]
MNSVSFSRNLRQLRQEKGLTQEQAAEKLGVSGQAVSRWECGTTLPDVMLLPQIARMYGVTVDDLYREEARAYPSYAQRLLAVYEASGRTEDFLAAEQEFSRIAPSERTADDLRAWGVLYHYMMKLSASQAQRKLEQAMESPEAPEHVRYSAAQQKLALMCDLGRGREEAERCRRELEADPADAQRWLLCAAAHYFAGQAEQALATAREGIARFPNRAALHIYAGDACRSLKRYEEAFAHWQKALELDSIYLDASYSMGFCYEELGDYKKAAEIWEALAAELDRRGLIVEKEWPRKMAESCREKLRQS